VHDHECDEWYDCNDHEEECIVEETPMKGVMYNASAQGSPPCLELVEYMCPNSLDLILILLPFSSLPLSPEHHSSKHMDYHVMCDLTSDFGHMDTLFDMLKGNVVDAI